MDIILGIANFLGVDEVVGKFVQGIASLFGFIVEIIGKLLFFVGDSAARMSIEMNTLLPQSPAITEGLKVTIPIANIAIVVGLIVIAFAVMTRAEWISTARESLPKLLTAVLLINFTYFALVYGAIQGVDTVTQRLYVAANYNEDTFRGVFQPDLNLKEMLRIRLAISKAEGEEIEQIDKYFNMMGDITTDVAIAFDNLNKTLPDGVIVTSAQRSIAVNNTARFLGLWFADPILQDGGSWVSVAQRLLGGAAIIVASTLTFGLGGVAAAGIGFAISTAVTAPAMISAIDDAQKNVYDAFGKDWKISELTTGIVGSLESSGVGYAEIEGFDTRSYHEEVKASMIARASEYFSCPMNADGAKTNDGCRDMQEASALIYKELKVWEETAIILAEVLFKTIWVFIGTLTLFGLASMFFIRYIALAILVVLFPIVWFGWIFPKIATAGGGKNIWTAWWSQFMRWLLFGPIAMFFIFLAIKVATQLDKVNPFIADPNAFRGSTIAIMASSIGDMLIVVGMLIGGLYTANKMGIAGSKMFYGSMIKARSWVGRQVKKGALAPLGVPKKYAKLGMEKTKDAAKAQRLKFTSDRLQTEKAQQRTDRLASGNRAQRYVARRRMAKSQAAQGFLKDRDKRRLFMYKDAEGKWKDNAPYLNSQILRGLLMDPATGKMRAQEALDENAMAVAYELAGEGKILPFETDFQQLLAYAHRQPGFVDRHNLQKAQNNLRKIGYAEEFESVAESGGDMYTMIDALENVLGKRARQGIDPDTFHPGVKGSGGASSDAAQAQKIAARTHWLAVLHPDQLLQIFAQAQGAQKADMITISQEYVEQIHKLITKLPGISPTAWKAMSAQEQTQAMSRLDTGQLAQIKAVVNPKGTLLERQIHEIDLSATDGPAQMKALLRDVFANNSNVAGNSSTLGAYISSGTSSTPPPPPPTPSP